MQLTTQQALHLMGKLKLEMIECRHHARGFLVVDGVRVFAVHCSFGNKELPGRVPHKFRKSLNLTVAEFERLRRCSMSREAYIDLIRRKGLLPS